MEQVVDRAATLDDPRGLIWAVTALWAAPELAGAVDYAQRAVELARERGLVSLLPVALGYQTTAELARNHFERARASAEEAYRLSEDIGQIWGMSALLAAMSAIELVRGDLEAAREHSRGGPRHGSRARRDVPGRDRELAPRSDRARRRAARRSDRSPAPGKRDRHPRSRTRWSVCVSFRRSSRPPLAAGREADAREAFVRYDEWVTRFPSETHVALRYRTRALLEPARADEYFTRRARPRRGGTDHDARPHRAALRRMAPSRTPAPGRPPPSPHRA